MNLKTLKAEIATATLDAGRQVSAVNLLAVSKTKPVSLLQAAIDAGQRDFGENYLQEAMEKIEYFQTSDKPPIWHFIGHIQSNKTRPIAENFDWVHTVSSLKIATRLNQQRPTERGKLKVFLQVNIDLEESKSGFSQESLTQAIEEISRLPMLEVRGLMAIPAPRDNLQAQREPFHRLAELLETLKTQYQLPGFTDLSMGMSSDLGAAILEGATWVRIGTRLFGSRD